jgi:alpha-1,2-mannosyltransferase
VSRRIDGAAVRAALDRAAFGPLSHNRILIGTVVALCLAVFVLQTISFAYLWDTDSPSYYIAARGLVRHIDIYDDAAFQALAAETFGKSIIVYPYIYPPLLAQLLVPLSALPYGDYFLVLYILNMLLTLACLYLLADVLDFKSTGSALPSLFLFVLVAANHPLEITIHHGQINILVLILALLFLKFRKSGREWGAGLALALAVFLKIYPVLLILPALASRKWKAALTFAAASAGLLLASIAASGTALWATFARSTLDVFLGRSTSVFIRGFQSSPNNLSLKGLLGQAESFLHLPPAGATAAYFAIAAGLFALMAAAARRTRLATDIPLQGALLLIATLVLAPLTWSHHYTVMMLPLAYVFGRAVGERRYAAFLPFGALGAIILYYPVGGGFPFNQARLLAALAFYAALLVFAAAPSRPSPLRIARRPEAIHA